ncbi:hypothetical protein QTO12_11655 [Vibrio owensii]|uniref:hypothetical protein n=1 Tax=Vibrio owensii TaxID=696485 RepID=UPI002F427756
MITREYMVEGDFTSDKSSEAYKMVVLCDKAASELGFTISQGTVISDGVCEYEDCDCGN